jgi:hypothetical protein
VIKRASATAVTCLLLAGAVGCGSGGDETIGNPKQELRQWFANVKASVAKMEQRQRGFTRFQVAGQPPAKSDLLELDPAGVRAGETAGDAADQLDTATALTRKEAAGLYCYFFAFYVDLESSPDKEEFEVVISNLVKTTLSPSATQAEVNRSADALREAMIESEKAGGRATEVAAAVLC